MLTSSDFVALCQVQVALLAQRWGAVWSIVYLTEELVEQGSSEAKLIPVVAYPETLVQWQRANTTGGALLPEELGDRSLLKLPAAPTTVPIPAWTSLTDEAKAQLLSSHQIVLPLMYEGILMGLLVTNREDRPWHESELNEIEKIAQTLAIARSLDRQNKWYEQQLIQQQRLQKQQRDLLDNLLHQFRNPLTALRTFGKLLLKRFAPGDANRTVADSIVRESDRLQELLLQFDRAIDLTLDDLEAQKALPPAQEESSAKPLPLLLGQGNSEQCLVAEVLEPLISSAKAIAQERNLELIAEILPNLPPVKADGAALREIFSNLIDNALKYTPSGGKIYIQAGKQRDCVVGIEISDTGLGIPQADLGKIFARHYRGVQQNSAIPGTGLGLAIVKELVEQMQGEIKVFSPAQNGLGTKFIVWLPVV